MIAEVLDGVVANGEKGNAQVEAQRAARGGRALRPLSDLQHITLGRPRCDAPLRCHMTLR